MGIVFDVDAVAFTATAENTKAEDGGTPYCEGNARYRFFNRKL